MIEKRLTSRLTEIWTRLKGDHDLPDIVMFNSGSIDDIWHYCLRLSVQKSSADTKTYQYDYMGQQIVEAYGKDLTGQTLSANIKNFPGAKILQRIDEIIKDPKIITDDGQFINTQSKVIKYRAILLPFGKTEVTHVIAGISWKAFG